MYSDAGLEFQAEKMLKYFEKNEILKYVMSSPNIQAGVVERANRTIKERLYRYFSKNNTLRWIKIIDQIVNGINQSVNRITGKKPDRITFKNASKVWEKLYKDVNIPKKKSKYKLEDIVRIAKTKGTFDKGYYPNYTDELFKIAQINNSNPPSYHIKDFEGNLIKGIFYEQLKDSIQYLPMRFTILLFQKSWHMFLDIQRNELTGSNLQITYQISQVA